MSNLVNTTKQNSERIKTELENAGIHNLLFHPFTAKYLPRVIHDDEHIHAAVFGRRKESEGFFGFVEGLLVATDERIIFLDHRPGYTTMDEIAYDVVSGVNVSSTLLQASVTLFTKITNYRLSFSGHTAAQTFADYVERRVILHDGMPIEADIPITPQHETIIDKSALEFLATHDVGVLSTIGRTGMLNSSTIYYVVLEGYIYFMTKENSQKAVNIVGNQHVSFVVFDESKLQTIQIQGIVEQVTDDSARTKAIIELAKPRTYEDGSHKPPILRTKDGKIHIYKVTPMKFDLVNYNNL